MLRGLPRGSFSAYELSSIQSFKCGRADQNIANMRNQTRIKDVFKVPVNYDFDLYSMGKDGKSKDHFTSIASCNDIVRANDGQFIGLVSEF